MTASAKALRARRAAATLLALLMACIALELLQRPPAPAAAAVLLAVLLLPLAPFLRPLWRGDARRALWLTLLLMPYFCWASMGAYLLPGLPGLLALLRALLIAACFGAALLMVRWQRDAG